MRPTIRCSGLPDRHWLLGIGKSLLWELIRQGRVPVLRLGRRTLISRAVVERLLAESEPRDTGERPARPLTRTAPRQTGNGR
jgi:excisionase family DNA binding protein